MIAENIKYYRELMSLSQNQLSKRLGISRSSVNAWELGISIPTTQYVVELSKLFHISTDALILGEVSEIISVNGLKTEQKEILYNLLRYFDFVNKNE